MLNLFSQISLQFPHPTAHLCMSGSWAQWHHRLLLFLSRDHGMVHVIKVASPGQGFRDMLPHADSPTETRSSHVSRDSRTGGCSEIPAELRYPICAG